QVAQRDDIGRKDRAVRLARLAAYLAVDVARQAIPADLLDGIDSTGGMIDKVDLSVAADDAVVGADRRTPCAGIVAILPVILVQLVKEITGILDDDAGDVAQEDGRGLGDAFGGERRVG